VKSVTGYSADRAGMKQEDVIAKVNGRTMHHHHSLQDILWGTNNAQLTIHRIVESLPSSVESLPSSDGGETAGGGADNARICKPIKLPCDATACLLATHHMPVAIQFEDFAADQRVLSILSLPASASAADVHFILTEQLPDKPSAVARGSKIGSAVESFIKNAAVLNQFGGAFEPAGTQDHFDLSAGDHSKTGLPGEIKYVQVEDNGKNSMNVAYRKGKGKGEDWLPSEFDYAVSGHIHQFLILFDRASIDEIKWPIFVTDTPEQRENWAAKVTTGCKTCGNWCPGGGISADIELLTQIIRHENYARIWGYFIGSSATTDAPLQRNPYQCKCDRVFKSWPSISKHRVRGCPRWPYTTALPEEEEEC